MTDSSTDSQEPILTFGDKRYELKSLSEETKDLVRGMQVADTQLRMHEDTLKVLSIGRQSIAMELEQKLKNENSIE